MGQFEPLSDFVGPSGQSGSKTAAILGREHATHSAHGAAAILAPEVGEALNAAAELAALAMGASSTFICLEHSGRQRVAASHGLSAGAVAMAESLSDRCMRSASRIDWRPDPSYEESDIAEQLSGLAFPLVGTDGKLRGAFGCFASRETLDTLSADKRRVFDILLERVTSRLQASEALEESLLNYRAAMTLDPLIRWTADARGNLLDLNERWEELTGGARDEALGGAWRGHVHSDDREAALRVFATALRQGTPIDVRFRLRTGSGEWRWARTRARARYDDDGTLLRWYGTTEDIHDQVTAELALRENSAQLRTVVNQAMVGILHRDLAGRLLMVNARFCELVGRAAAELDGLPLEAFTHPDDIPLNAALCKRHAVSGEPFQIEKRYLRPDGSSLWCAIHVSYVCDEAGVPRSTITVAQDIAVRRQAEAELRESKDLLQTVIDSVSDLIFVKDIDGDFVLANKAMREGCLDRAGDLPPDSLEAEIFSGYRTADGAVMRNGAPMTFEELIAFEGQLRPFETIKVPWRKGPEIAGVIGVSRDMAERRKSEAALRESEEHYRYSVELNPQVPWTAMPDGSLHEVGPRWEEITGIGIEGARGHGWVEAVHPDDVDRTVECWQGVLASHEPIDIEYRLRRGDGTYGWVRARAAPRLNAAGEVVRWYGTLEDVDEHRRDQDALRQSEERFRLAAQAARLGIWDYDIEHGTREWSDELRRILGLPDGAQTLPETALQLVHPDDRRRVAAVVQAAAMPGGEQRFEMTFRIRRVNDGQLRWICANGWRSEGASGRTSRVLVAVRDITESRTADERIRWAARHDALTRLPNRAAFHDALEEVMARSRSPDGAAALLLIDVDNLKQTNDCLGHDAGDALLATIAARLETVAGARGFTARLGGDEFALLFSGPDTAQDLARVSAELAPLLAEAFVHEGRILDCRATCGGSLFPRDGVDGAELLKAADLALYAAKVEARGGLLMFRPDMRSELERRSSMISMARAAIDDERVTPFYQPKVELATGRLVGFEARLRWRHPSAGLRPPGEISAAFDNLDLARALSDRMFDQAIGHMRRWLDDGVTFGTVAINAASAEFRRDDLAERILERLERGGVPADLLEIEVTETVFLGTGAGHVDRALKLLSGAGVRIALDDFGTGYASLSHLKQYAVDTIKIDRSFVCNLESATGDAAIVDAVINLGASLGMDIVAEGIETPEQARYLLDQGCAFGQGYLFGRASPPATIPSLVGEWAPARIAALLPEAGKRRRS
jgi:diguanylate cyclase (GGDEF)-like protein/PAS domain S-box-containing protein